ncbi:MAG: hypothetical protein O3A63_02970 [Proteobacteria bacterium]|nr:hypothetical protein [Pseudomonadota bacterium]
MVVTPRFEQTGSIGADTVSSHLLDVATSLDIQSDAPRDQIEKLIATAERMCFLMDAIRNPHPVQASVRLNGEELTSYAT